MKFGTLDEQDLMGREQELVKLRQLLESAINGIGKT
jgi:hypothetical protein